MSDERPQGIDKTSLSDVEVGDHIVIDCYGVKALQRVTRVPKSRIVVEDGSAFMKGSGNEVGKYENGKAYPLGKQSWYGSPKTYYDRYLDWLKDSEIKKRKSEALTVIKSVYLPNLSADQLERIAKIVEEENCDN